MSAHAYTENLVVEQPAIGLFAELGLQTVSALEETFGATGTLLSDAKEQIHFRVGLCVKQDQIREILQQQRPPSLCGLLFGLRP